MVVIANCLAIFETAVVELRGSSVVKMDAIPAAATKVEKMESRRVGNGKGDGVGFGADSLDECAVCDPDAIMALKNHSGSRLDEERVSNAYIAGDEDRVSIPSTILIAIYFYV